MKLKKTEKGSGNRLLLAYFHRVCSCRIKNNEETTLFPAFLLLNEELH